MGWKCASGLRFSHAVSLRLIPSPCAPQAAMAEQQREEQAVAALDIATGPSEGVGGTATCAEGCDAPPPLADADEPQIKAASASQTELSAELSVARPDEPGVEQAPLDRNADEGEALPAASLTT